MIIPSYEKIKTWVIDHKLVVIFTLIVFLFSLTAIRNIQYDLTGDAVNYVEAGNVLTGASFESQTSPVDFIEHRILTTFLATLSVHYLGALFGDVRIGWVVFDIFFYILINVVFFRLLAKIFQSERVAFLGGLFFAANFDMFTAGLGNFMDISGWSFYIFSIFFTYKYIENKEYRNIITAALFMAVGCFFKENSYMAYFPLLFVLFYENRANYKVFVKKLFYPTLIVVIPILFQHINVFLSFGYSYFRWVKINKTVYHYNSRLVEYIKAFGSMLNLLAPLSLLGLLFAKKVYRQFNMNSITIVYIIAIFISAIPTSLWPGIAQRVLFMVVPGLVILSCFLFKRYEKRWYLFFFILIPYIVINYLMDPYILNYVNLPL